MSHIVTIDTKVYDLVALEAACIELGLIFKKDQRTYAWYGVQVGDYPLPAGMSARDLGKCAHAIRVPGSSYEVGLVRDESTEGYQLAFDFWGNDGARILEAIGAKGGKLLQRYGVIKASVEAAKQGYRADRTTKSDGSITLTLTK